MASEYEELKLVVSLNDQASAGVNNYQKSIASFTSGQSASHVEGFKRQNSLVNTLLKSTGLEAGKTSTAFGELAGRFTVGGAAMGVAAGVIFAAMAKLNGAAKEIVGQAREMQRVGVDPAQGRNIVEQYEKVGMTAAEATENIQKGVESAHEAHKRFRSELFEGLKLQFSQQSGGGLAVIKDYREALEGAKDTREQMNVNAEFQDRFGKLALEGRTYETKELENQAVARNEAVFRQVVGFNEAFSLAKQVTALDADRAAALKEMNDRAKEFNDLWNATAVNLERIVNVFSTAAMGGKDSGFIQLLEIAHGLTRSIFDVMEHGAAAFKDRNFWKEALGVDLPEINSWDRFGRAMYGPENWEKMRGVMDPLIRGRIPPSSAPPSSPFGLDQAQPFAGLPGIGGTESENLEANTKELRKLNDNLYAMLHPGGAGGVGGSASGSEAASAPSIVVPGLAQGGIVTRPTFALLGERGPEAVVPLTHGGSAPNMSFGGMSFGGVSMSQGGISMSHRGGNIRMMADGGIVTKPTMALIGEAGPEAVVPLNKKLPIPQAYNNPGDVKWGQFAQEHGAIGRGARGGHAVFASAEEGQQALSDLLEERGATGKSLSQINKWYAEDPKWGAGVAKKLGGIDRTRTLGSQGVSSADLAMAIAAQEGFRATIDGAARSQQIEAGGHIQVRIGKQSTVGTQGAPLFKPIPEGSLAQMVPAGINVTEMQRSTQPSLAER